MAQELTTARRNLSQVNSLLRQGKLQSAVQNLRSALTQVAGQALMKAEREEFERLFDLAVDYLNADPHLRKIYPLSLNYVSGGEKLFLEEITELLRMLEDASLEEAEEAARQLAEKRSRSLEESQKKLDDGKHDEARAQFAALSGQYPDDAELKADIGDRLLKASLYEDAAAYLSEAVALDPLMPRYYNRLGMALRKLARFDVAEGCYLKALELIPEDSNLLFNIGRLYLEWKKWDKAVEFGERAAKLHPEFTEALKLASFARKQME